MKNLLTIIFVLFITSAPALSDDACTQVALYAEKVMEYRQTGKSIVDAFKEIPAAEIAGFPEENLKAFRMETIKEAYGKPFFSTPDMKKRQVVEFMNGYYLSCEETMSK